jgi:ABC-type uncharacterized transport system involved in gliding motility auxiliary subunit
VADLRRSLLTHAWAQGILWLLVAVVANHLASVAFWRIDLTRDQRYTLSPVAVSSVSALDKPLVARVFFTPGLQAPYHDHQAALVALLEELRARSGGRLEIQVSDPSGDKAATEAARGLGIDPITYTFRDWDRQEARQVFMGVAFQYGERTEPVPAVTSIERMEYDVVRAIRRVTTPADKRKKLGYLLGEGEPDLSTFGPDHPLGKLRAALQESYDLRPLALGDDAIPADLDGMLVVAPQQAVPPIVQLHLDQFLMSGKPIAWFLSGVQPDFKAMRTREIRHDLGALLARYGVTLGRDLVLDRQSNEPMVVPVSQDGQNRLAKVNYPLAIATTDIVREARPVRGLRRVVLPFSTTLAVDPPPGAEAEVWIRSMPTSAVTKGARPLAVDRVGAIANDEVPGPFPLMVALSGTLPSAFADRTIPVPDDPSAPRLDPAELVTSSRPTRTVVVSSGDFVANNVDLVLNTVDWLLDDPTLLSIRPLQAGDDPLTPPPAAQALGWKLAIAGAPVLALLAVGALMSWRGR